MKTFIKGGLVALAAAAILTPVAMASPANDKGVTWSKISHDNAQGVDLVGCDDGTTKCDPYQGDALCSIALPIMCINKSNAAVPAGYDNSNKYRKWSGGHLANSHPIKGSDISGINEANQICENQFGKGWRMADHHDGWGWNFAAYGNLRKDTRMWVSVKNQPNGHCW